MDNFDLQKYLASGKIHADTKILTEDLGVELPKVTSQKANAKITNSKQFAEFILDAWNTISSEENESVTGIQDLEIAKAKLVKVAKMADEPVSEDARTDAEEEGYKDGMKDEKADLQKEDARTDAEEEGYEDGFKDAKADMKDSLTKMKVSELKAKIREDILSAINEADEEVDVDIDVEDKVEVDAEADDIEIERKGVKTKVEVGLSPEEEIIQDSLKAAMDAADALGNDKLSDQIGNTITFFTREYVVGDR